jgi:hypothetical protein
MNFKMEIMKKAAISMYILLAGSMFVFQSCEDDPICPNGNDGNDNDSTWIYDSTFYNGDPNQDPYDSTGNNNNGNDPLDSLNWGGGTDPNDSLGGN